MTYRIENIKIMRIFAITILIGLMIHNNSIAQSNFDHSSFNSLLKKHVDSEGWVDYDGFMKDKKQLTAYLDLLKKNPPNENTWSDHEQLAYWINAYNAFTLDLVLQHYPIESIKDIGSKIQIPFVNSPWDIKFIEINGEKYDLNNIEHGIIRKKFDEPRIHFAVNCASYSCPLLRNEAYMASKLDEQLDDQTRRFINDPKRNIITTKKAQVSKLFSWYTGDFTKNSSLKEFIAQYSSEEVTNSTKISYLDYQWQLNSQKNK